MKIVMALFPDYEAAEIVVESLLDSGFTHQDISLRSGNYWPAELAASGRREYPKYNADANPGVIIQVSENTQARNVRDFICNSGALDVCERDYQEAASWESEAIPVRIPQSIERHFLD